MENDLINEVISKLAGMISRSSKADDIAAGHYIQVGELGQVSID